ncbi:MAG: hypothetical protein GWP05_07470 [Anaerolineaceae bacterium]|nr:hypothetical protein [Anaerolineaceae bacterium]
MDTEQLTLIAMKVIAPVIVMLAIGFVLGWRKIIEPEPLARMYLFIFAPALIFVNMVSADMTGTQLGQVLLFCFTSVAILFLLAQGVSRLLGHDRGMRGAFTNSIIIYNSANYGLPVQQQAFGDFGGAIQALVLVTQSLTGFTLGMFMAASNSPSLAATIKRIIKVPIIWGLIIGALCRSVGLGAERIETVPLVWVPLKTLAVALVPVALLSLGAQLSRVKIHGKMLNISVGVFMRLIVGPAVGLGVGLALRVLGAQLGYEFLMISDRLLAVLVVSISFPTAVFSAVLATEFRNNADYAAAAVFVSTLISIMTVTAVIYLANIHLL